MLPLENQAKHFREEGMFMQNTTKESNKMKMGNRLF